MIHAVQSTFGSRMIEDQTRRRMAIIGDSGVPLSVSSGLCIDRTRQDLECNPPPASADDD